MLEGIDTNEIIVGAYTDRDGRVCPMLAAHRNGGRTSLASFARAWDRYTCARRPRPATEHRALVDARPKRRRALRPTGETSRLGELRDRAGWSWLRVFRRYDDYTA